MEITKEEVEAIQTALTELEFSTESGGANEGNEDAENACSILSRLISRIHGGV